jgi:hypothetical protein
MMTNWARNEIKMNTKLLTTKLASGHAQLLNFYLLRVLIISFYRSLPRSRPISRPSTAAARKNIEPVKVSTFNPEHLPAPTPPRVPDVRRAISQRSSPTRLHRFSAPKGSHKTDLHVRPISKTEDHAGVDYVSCSLEFQFLSLL